MGEPRNAYEILQVQPSAVAQVITAAYRALARLHHPDHNWRPDASFAMAELNSAYAELRDPQRRAAYDGRQAARGRPSSGLSDRMQGVPREKARSSRGPLGPGSVVIDFGRYAGQTLRDVAGTDPGYLEWLKRHSSGLRYRHHIDEALGGRATVRR